MIGPDHKASLDPLTFKKLVLSIRNIEQALGDGVKKVTKSESKNISLVRKSIFAYRSIKKGEVFTLDNICTKRPCSGISAIHWDKVLGLKAKKDFLPDEKIII